MFWWFPSFTHTHCALTTNTVAETNSVYYYGLDTMHYSVLFIFIYLPKMLRVFIDVSKNVPLREYLNFKFIFSSQVTRTDAVCY